MSDNNGRENQSAGSELAAPEDIRRIQQRATFAALAAEMRRDVVSPSRTALLRAKLSILSVRLGTFARGATASVPRINPLFFWSVIVPTLLSIIYFYFIAADVYLCESQFIVRTPQTQSPMAGGGLGVLLQSSGLFTTSQDDTYSVESYIKSLDALRALNQQLNLRKSFGGRSVDFVKRFGMFASDTSDESLLRYYQWWIVDTEVDTTSGIATLSVRAYSADDAYKINETLLQLGDALVNRMNDQARKDLVGYAQRDVDVAEERAKRTRLAMSAFRNEKSVLNPELQGGMQLQGATALTASLVSAKAQLAQLLAVAPENPQIPSLKRQIQAIEQEVHKQNQDVAGHNGSLAHKAADFDELAVELDFADKQLAVARASLDQARSDAMNKQLYLDRVVEPARPSSAWEPRRFKDVIGTFLLSLLTWLVLTLIISGVREHSD